MQSVHTQLGLCLNVCVRKGFVIRPHLLVAENTVLPLGLEEVEGWQELLEVDEK